ncbi:hypothetical protein GTU79_10820 [Sodalis ligni]|uniref:hypothetical protein n=1 Tax=Sodalis ligni TaxID=2697027 RepID=UPI001BDE44B6|nr:hypothetical protein [Sodalis ligni]QWA13104.1 hypothetical protein GTU79_10820 [Sodalis ligni]
MKYPIFSVDTPSFRVICRKAIRRLYGKTPFEALPPKILAEANHIDAEQAEALLNHLTVSKSSILPAGTILDSGLLVPNLTSSPALIRANWYCIMIKGTTDAFPGQYRQWAFRQRGQYFLIPGYPIIRPFWWLRN